MQNLAQLLLVVPLVSGLSVPAAKAPPAAAASGYKLQDLPGSKSTVLLFTWSRAAADMRANGFSPATEAVGDYMVRLKNLNDLYPKLVSQSKIIGLCEQGNLNYANLEEPHASIGERLSRTRLRAALSAGKGSALAFVSEWSDHVCIDACVINPSYLLASEEAEATLLKQIAEEAIASGCKSIRLRPMYQAEGEIYYERCGFFSRDDDDSEGDERLLFYGASLTAEEGASSATAPDHIERLRAEGALVVELREQMTAALAERMGQLSEVAREPAEVVPDDASPEADTFGPAAPEGFTWGETY